MDINECMDTECLNGGTCVDEVAAFRCQCVKGFNGEICEANIDDCTLEVKCGNGRLGFMYRVINLDQECPTFSEHGPLCKV